MSDITDQSDQRKPDYSGDRHHKETVARMGNKPPACIRADKFGGTFCYSPTACAGFGYCRQRNADAGGMHYVTPADQVAWRAKDGR